MKFDLASVTSQDMSSAWVNAMPQLVNRRGGIALPVAGTLRRHSESGKTASLIDLRSKDQQKIFLKWTGFFQMSPQSPYLGGHP